MFLILSLKKEENSTFIGRQEFRSYLCRGLVSLSSVANRRCSLLMFLLMLSEKSDCRALFSTRLQEVSLYRCHCECGAQFFTIYAQRSSILLFCIFTVAPSLHNAFCLLEVDFTITRGMTSIVLTLLELKLLQRSLEEAKVKVGKWFPQTVHYILRYMFWVFNLK